MSKSQNLLYRYSWTRVMSQIGGNSMRSRQEIASELAREQESKKILDLSLELNIALTLQGPAPHEPTKAEDSGGPTE
jgi:hypothetical protein